MPSGARPAIQAGLDEWAARVSTEVPVVVDVTWEPLPQFVAAASEPLALVPDPATGWHVPIALANARAGVDLEPRLGDVRVTFSSRERWQFDPASPAPAGVVDLMTFTLHEVGHGIGLYSGTRRAATGVAFVPGPTVLDSLLTAPSGARLLDVVSLSNGTVTWAGTARDANGSSPRISAGAFEPHTSLMHLDENAYPRGSADALMTEMIRRGETVHSIGPAALGMLRDMGWTTTPAVVSTPAPRPAPTPAPAQLTPPPSTTTSTTAAPATTTSVPVPTTAVRALPINAFDAAATRASSAGSARPGLIVAGFVALAVVGHAGRRLRAERPAP